MKHRLFSLLSAGLLGLHTTANGQSIVAGQTSGVAYTDINPDRVTTIAVATGQLSDSLDLNLDGTYDLRWTARTVAYSPPAGQSSWDARALVRPLHDNIEIAYLEYLPSPTERAYIVGFSSTTVIEAQIPQSVPPSTLTRSWRGSVTWANEADFVYTGRGAGGLTFYGSPGNYQPNTDRYMGVRFRSTTSSSWKYGWVRVQIQAVENSVTITVKDYAFEQTILGTKMQAANTWQVYPIPVEHMLALRSNTSGPKHAELLDTQGRVLFATHNPKELDLSRFPAGVYILRLTDEKGTVTKRINKL